MTPRVIAENYIRRAWAPIPVPYKSKVPALDDWTNLRITADTVAEFFNGEEQNIGVLLGTPSNNLTDIDLDCPEAVALAPIILPPTSAVFGRAGKPRSHFLYTVVEPICTKRFQNPINTSETLVEQRSTGGQTVFPGSVHPSGEQIEWASDGKLGRVPGDELEAAVRHLAVACLVRRYGDASNNLADVHALLPALANAPEKVQEVARVWLRIEPQHQASHDFQKTKRSPRGSDGFWRAVNTAALENLDKWVRSIFPKAVFQTGTRAWRVSSRNLGRNLQEDLSLHPGGIQDFGEETSLTAIDTVLKFGGAADAQQAALWLCEQIGVAAESLGYNNSKEAPAAGKPQRKKAAKKSGGLEDSIALAFASKHADDFRFIALWSRWMRWDSTRWHPEATLRAFDEARKLCREAGDARAKTVAAVVTLARADRAIAATEDQWDTDSDLTNAGSLTIDLRTGDARSPERLDYITKTAAIAPAPPGASHPLWTFFLERVTNNNPALIGFLQRYLGYCLTGHTLEHALVFLYGLGANGKSVFVNTVSKIFGDYAIVAPMELFMASKHERHPTDIAKLRGARLVTAQETEKGRRWDVAKIKNLTSDDKLTGRFMRQDFFDFTPSHKLIIAANHKPSLRSIDEAIRRRFLLVPFTVEIPKPERDPDLARKFEPEWPAILRWMVDGSLEWKRHGLVVPAIVRDATDAYLADQDTLAQWLDEWIERDARAFTLTTELFKNWKAWCEQRNHFIGTETAFSDDLADRGFERARKEYGRGFKGLMLRASNVPRDGILQA